MKKATKATTKTTKKTEISDEDLFSQIAQATAGNVLADLETCNFFIDTGNFALNYICSGRFIGGGIPGNRITEFYGPSSSGKSLIASNILRGCQKIGGWPIILDCENATNGEFMERTSHLNLKKILRYAPFTLEKAFDKIHNAVNFIRAREKEHKREPKPIVFVYDSISVSPCEREFSETNLPENYNPTQWKKIVGRKEQPGERAKVCSKELRKLQSRLEKYGATILIINQTREKIGVLYGNPETTAGGGNALPFYASCRLRTATRKKIENKELKTFAGVNMAIKNVKNRTFRPFAETEGVKLYFDTGVNPLTGLVTILKQAERIVAKGNGSFFVKPEFTETGEEYKFKAGEIENVFPLKVLLDNPRLVDAKTTEEVQEYLADFKDAIDLSESGVFSEKAVSFDAEGNPLIESDEDAEELGELEE